MMSAWIKFFVTAKPILGFNFFKNIPNGKFRYSYAEFILKKQE